MKLSAKHSRLARRQLDEKLAPLSTLPGLQLPRKGWIQAIQDALGMTGRQLARRLGLSPARISQAKAAEMNGATTLQTMSRIAQAMGCKMVYAFVPNSTLESYVRQRAEALVQKRMKRVHHTMALEGQALSHDESDAYRIEATDELVHSMPRDFWDDETPDD